MIKYITQPHQKRSGAAYHPRFRNWPLTIAAIVIYSIIALLMVDKVQHWMVEAACKVTIHHECPNLPADHANTTEDEGE